MEFLLPSIIGGVAATMLGMLWYSPKVFGTKWMKLVGMSPEDAKKPTAAVIALGVIAAIVKVAVLAGFINLVNPGDLSGALLTAGFVWLGFFATSDLSSILWENRSPKLFVINTSYNLVMLLMSATIIFYIL